MRVRGQEKERPRKRKGKEREGEGQGEGRKGESEWKGEWKGRARRGWHVCLQRESKYGDWSLFSSHLENGLNADTEKYKSVGRSREGS